MSLHSYHSRQTPGMSVGVDVGENRIQCKFINHLFQTEDDEVAKAVDFAMTVSMALRQKIGKIDKVAAEQELMRAMAIEQSKNQGVLGAGGTGILDEADAQKPSISNPTQNFTEVGVGNTLEQINLQPGQAAPPLQPDATPAMPNEIPLDAPPSQPGAGQLPAGAVPAEVPAAAPSLNIAPIHL